ncbi:stalk domain-containing protein [Cohnella suwonensis]|uniref:Stalk domain-containing protein n=1 Tax=Cohnella suwonensis TaxID=696072 RepID=A0ABW0LSH6_9BACL
MNAFLSLMLAVTLIAGGKADQTTPTMQVHSAVNGNETFAALIQKGRAYVDADGLLKILPYRLDKDNVTRDAKGHTLYVHGESYPDLKSDTLIFKKDAKSFKIGKADIALQDPIVAIGDRLYIPLRGIAHYYHLKLSIDKNKTIQISKANHEEKMVIANTAVIARANADRLIALTNEHIQAANDKDFAKYLSTLLPKLKEVDEYNPCFFVWLDAEKQPLKLRRIDFVSENIVGKSPRIIAEVKWTGRQMQVAYLKDKNGEWKIGSLD